MILQEAHQSPQLYVECHMTLLLGGFAYNMSFCAKIPVGRRDCRTIDRSSKVNAVVFAAVATSVYLVYFKIISYAEERVSPTHSPIKCITSDKTDDITNGLWRPGMCGME